MLNPSDIRSRFTAPGRALARTSAGNGFPPALTGGESLPDGAKVDWLTATWLPEPDEHIPATVQTFLNSVFSEKVHGVSCPAMFGYESGVRYYRLLNDGKEHHIARIDYGGNHHKGRARLDLSGSGCALVTDWHAVQSFVSGLFDASLTRVDLAADCLQGQYTVEDALNWYESGEFNAGGRMPRHSLVGDWLNPKNGRTFEVGRRENGKMLRAYEKGRQLGDSSSIWTRFEVEIRNIDRVIPFEILTRRNHYFVGAYKCLQRLIDVAGDRIKTIQKEAEISLEHLTNAARTSYGALINVMRVRASMTFEEIYESLTRPGVPRRLEKASLVGFPMKAPQAT